MMAGFREFATGEVLTSANVNNFLMKQSVMVFADAAARTSALGAEVAEGMLTYNLDTDQLEVFDGSAFVSVASTPTTDASLLTSGTLASARLPVMGIGSNVVQAARTTLFTTTSTTFVNITSVEVTITPTSTNSKVLLLFSTSTENIGDAHTNYFELRRNSLSVGVGTETNPASVASGNGLAGANQITRSGYPAQFMFLDSPATTSATTYLMRVRVSGGTARVGNVRGDQPASVPTILIAIEVAG